MFRIILIVVLAYVMAAPLTVHISMDMTMTHWDNMWTYAFWIFSFFIWRIILIWGIAASTFITAMFLNRWR